MSSLAFHNNALSKHKPQASILSLLHILTHFIEFSSLHIYPGSCLFILFYFSHCVVRNTYSHLSIFMPAASFQYPTCFSFLILFFSSSQILAPCTASLFFCWQLCPVFLSSLLLLLPSDVLCLGVCTSLRKEFCCPCFFRTSHAYLNTASICCPGTCIVCPSTLLR